MRHQALRPVALMLTVLLASAAPARASTVDFVEVVRAIADGPAGRRPAVEFRLRAVGQSGAVAQQGPASSSDGSSPSSNAPATDPASTGTTSIIAAAPQQQGGGQVETVDLGDVTGTVCDCGIIPPPPPVPGGGFPLWPLAALGAIPLFFIPGGGDDTPPFTPPIPIPTPTPNAPIPEPATLLLFGSGLLALGGGARRRRRQHARRLSEAGMATTGEV